MAWDPGVIAAGIQATGQVVAGAAGAAGLFSSKTFAKEQFWRQAEFQKEMNAKQEAYQDKVNQQNFDWNRAKNVRARMEEAGYNPYLTGEYGQAGAMASGTTFGANASENAPVYANPIGDAIRIGGEGASSYANALSSLLASQEKQYDFDRKKTANLILDEKFGQTAGADAHERIAHVLQAEELAKQQSALAAVEQMRMTFYNSPAFDENNQPIVDEATGEQMTNFTASQRTELKSKMKSFDELCKKIENLDADTLSKDFDVLIKKYDLDFMKPQELANLKATYDNLKQQLKVMKSEVLLNKANAAKASEEVNESRARQNLHNRLAELAGQQKLTEEQQTHVRANEALIGGAERLANILDKLSPKNAYQLSLDVVNGTFGRIFGFMGQKVNTRWSLSSKIQDMSDNELVRMLEDFYQQDSKSRVYNSKNDSTWIKPRVMAR